MSFTPDPPIRQPVFNLPGVVLALISVLVLIHVVRELLLGDEADFAFVLSLAFIPIRVIDPQAIGLALPGGEGARLWSFATYALLHADWSHLVINALWLAAFGSPLAWRFGPMRFLLLSGIGAIAGAALHLAIYPDALVPMVGASAAISAQMAGAVRFIFDAGGPLGGLRRSGHDAHRMPARSLAAVMSDNRALLFLAVWFGLNILFGIGGGQTGLSSGAIAWDAHIGGFIAGLFLFPLFDPARGDRR
jgi:membrane associated rhomboid family serine protease